MNQVRERFNKKLNDKDQIVLDESNELIFLYPYVKDIIKEIRENNTVTSGEYHLRMQARLIVSTLAASGGWYVLAGDEQGTITASYKIGEEHSSELTNLISQLNQLLSKLPASNSGFWAEIIRMPDTPDLFAAVRKNGFGFDSPTDVVIISLDPSKTIVFGNRELELLAKCFQERTVKYPDSTGDQPSRDAAYRCIIRASLHPADSIVLTADRVHDTALNESGKRGFQQYSVFAADKSSEESDTASAAQTRNAGEPKPPI